MAGARPGVHRPRHDGADRRPEAGHLRLPRRRRHDVPPGGRDRRPPSRPCRSTGAATRRCSTPSSGCSRGAALGDDRIVVRDVEAHHQGSRLAGAPSPRRSGCGWSGARRSASAAAAPSPSRQVRPHIARDLALDVRRLLASGATYDGRADPAARRRGDQLPPRRPGRRPAAALQEVGVPAVIAGGGSVFATAGRGGVAEPARGARAAAPQPAGPGRRAHLLLRPHRRRAGRGRRRPHRRASPTPLRALGRAVHHPRHRRRARGRERRAGSRRGCSPRSAASAASPTCATSARRCTRSPSPSGTAWSRC